MYTAQLSRRHEPPPHRELGDHQKQTLYPEKRWPSGPPAPRPQARCSVLFSVLGPHPQHREVLRLGVESELQLPTYTTATALWDLSRNCYLHHSSRHYQILNPLSEAREQTCVLMDPGQIHNLLSHDGRAQDSVFKEQMTVDAKPASWVLKREQIRTHLEAGVIS